eukprot:492570-Rhodomonas_salina.2
MDAHSRRPASTKSQRTRLKPSTSAVTWERASTALLLNTPTLLRGRSGPVTHSSTRPRGHHYIHTTPLGNPIYRYQLRLAVSPPIYQAPPPTCASYLRLLPAPLLLASPPPRAALFKSQQLPVLVLALLMPGAAQLASADSITRASRAEEASVRRGKRLEQQGRRTHLGEDEDAEGVRLVLEQAVVVGGGRERVLHSAHALVHLAHALQQILRHRRARARLLVRDLHLQDDPAVNRLPVKISVQYRQKR